MSITYRIDIDGTIAEPKFYHENLHTCCDWYVNQEVTTQDPQATGRGLPRKTATREDSMV
jgi:hypothetical protein